ncbi:MAG: BamA/TamA family outer membrane protein [Pseudomonadota bacterium]
MSALLAALLLLGAARAEEPAPPGIPWYVGQPVVMVSLEAVDGGLPGEDLEPLLNVRQGEALSPWAVRSDLALLQRVGQFASAEAFVEPWVGYDDEGLPQEAVRLVYRVRPPPRVRRLRTHGARALGRRAVVAASGLGEGDPFYEAQDVAAVSERVRAAYAREGFPRAVVEVVPHPLDPRRLDLDLRLAEGSPDLLESVHFIGIPEGMEREVTRILRHERLRHGRRITRDQVNRARAALDTRLHDRGYTEAEVRTLLAAGGEGGVQLHVAVQAGPRLQIAVRGVGPFARRRLRRAAREQLTGRVTDEILGEAGARVEHDLRERGWLDAHATLAAEERSGGRLRVTIVAARGAQHRLGTMSFTGAMAFTERYLGEALREASPEVLGRGHVTEEAVEDALRQVVEFYRSQGYLDARLSLLSLGRGAPGLAGRVPVDLAIAVEEGPRTTLGSLALDGAPCPGSQAVLDAASDMLGAPLDPSAMDRLARAIADACTEEGYLDADVQVRRAIPPGSQAADLVFVVDPGPLVVLRNVIVQGHTHTRRQIIEREIALTTGQPITRGALQETREGLYDLSLFKRVDTTLFGDEDRVKDLLVQVDELPRVALEIGGGASTDQGVRAFARATHRNLWGSAHRLSFLGQGGLGYEGDEWKLDTTRPEWRAGLRYEAPNLPGDGQRSFLDLVLNEEQQHATYRISRTGGGVGVQAPVGAHGEIMMDYRLERRRLRDVDPGALLQDDPWLPLLGLPDSPVPAGEPFDPTAWGEPALPSEARISSGPGFLLVTDARDDPQNPRRGVRWTLAARIEDGVLSAVPFLTARSQLQTLLPAGPIGLLFGLQAGIGQAMEAGATLPIEERFALGGAGSLRGFKRESVGPRNRIAAYDPGFPSQIQPLVDALHETDPWRWVATGGDAMAVATLELKAPLPLFGLDRWPDAALVGFADVGNAFLVGGNAATTSTQEGGEPFLRTGLGVGLRYFTAVGPLQLDLGFNPWYMPARDESLMRVHLSLGTL